MDKVRTTVRRGVRVIAKLLNKVSGGRVSPSTITLIGLLAHVGIAWLIAMQENYWAAGLLVVFGLFDVLDGELARLQKRESSFGMFLDSVTDRMKEVLLYSGAAYAIIASESPYWAVWVVVACGGAVVVSYTNAWGEVVTAGNSSQVHKQNKTFRSGLMGFEMRMAVLILGLLTNRLLLALVVIAIGSWFTALQRILKIRANLNDVQN